MSRVRIWRGARLRRPLAGDEDAVTRLIEVGRALGPVEVGRLGLASVGLGTAAVEPGPALGGALGGAAGGGAAQAGPGAGWPQGAQVGAGLVALALDLPASTFCLTCTASERAGTEALLALGSGLVLAADGEWAAGLLIGDAAGHGGDPLATVVATRSALAAYPGLGLGAPDYVEAACLDLVAAVTHGLAGDCVLLGSADRRVAARAGFPGAMTAPPGAAGVLYGLLEWLESARPGQTMLAVSYGAGSAADALLVRKEGG